jgi:transcriptional regulator with XRE-family HTH domain
MKLLETHTDEAILAETGRRITRCRLAQQLTQAEVAERAGIGKRTLERVEAGLTAQFSTMIRIFRVLGLLPKLDQMLAEPPVRPLEAAARKGKTRQRASGQAKSKAQSKPGKPWSWDEPE